MLDRDKGMTSIEQSTTGPPHISESFYYSQPSSIPERISTTGFIQHESPCRPCSFIGTQSRKPRVVDIPSESTVRLAKKPPPVPPRGPKTYSATFINSLSKSSTLERPRTVSTEQTIAKKKIPPPVPKKPTNLRILKPGRQTISTTPTNDYVSPTQHLNMRLFALLLSPTSSPVTEVVVNDGSRTLTPLCKGIKRSMTVYGSTPHLDKMVGDVERDLDHCVSQDDNNNHLNVDRQGQGANSNNSKGQGQQQRTFQRFSRATRRKSLPLLAKSGSITPTRTEPYSDGRSVATSRCNSSFGAEQGSLLSSSSLSASNPPPLPIKDYPNRPDQKFSSPCDNSNCLKGIVADKRMEADEETNSIVFFSTISTVSSRGASRACSTDDKSLDFATAAMDSAKANNGHLRSRHSRHTARDANALLNAFAIEQNRRIVSIIERNARIIKWLYNCSKS